MVQDEQEVESKLRSATFQNQQAIQQVKSKSDDELARLSATLRTILEVSNDAILVTNQDGEVATYNQKFLELWLIPEELVHSQKFQEGCSRHLNEPQVFLDRIRKIYQGDSADSFDLLQLLDGRIIERDSKCRFLDRKNIGRVWSFREVTSSRRLAEVDSRLAAIIQSSDDAIISKNLNGIIATWNSAAERMLGYSSDEVIGQHISILIPPDRLQEEEIIISRIKRSERVEHYETVRRRKDGSLLDVSLTISPIMDADGNIIGASKIARDISVQKRINSEREGLFEFERAARVEAERINIMKDEFLATLSHELRTPLNAILGWAQLLSRSTKIEDFHKGIDVIERNTRMQARLIEDLLDMSSIISGKMRLDIQDVDLHDRINSAIASIRHAADAKEIELQIILDSNISTVRGDAGRLQQCLWNLLSNAIKFTTKGGTIRLEQECINSHIEIRIIDSGRGIDPDFLPFVFDRFRQADSSTTRNQGGLGLGLSIVKKLIELHGGSIKAQSPGKGKGSTFCIDLPVVAAYSSNEIPRSQLSPSRSANLNQISTSLAGIKVLVVDDEEDARILLKHILEECGASVILAETSQEGMELVCSDRPDVILSDIGMPNEDGYQFIQRIRHLKPEDGGDIPAAALTAFARPSDRTRVLLAGYEAHIAKPADAGPKSAL